MMGDYVEAGTGGLGWQFFVFPVIATIIWHFRWTFLGHVGRFMLWVMCEPVQVPTGQTDIPISEDTTSHTGMPETPVPATRAEPSHTRADTRTREVDDREVYERVQVRDSRGRYTSKRVLIRIDMT